MSWYYDYNTKPTIETDEGIKAKSKRGAFVKSWWATRWITAMEPYRLIIDCGMI